MHSFFLVSHSDTFLQAKRNTTLCKSHERPVWNARVSHKAQLHQCSGLHCFFGSTLLGTFGGCPIAWLWAFSGRILGSGAFNVMCRARVEHPKAGGGWRLEEGLD